MDLEEVRNHRVDGILLLCEKETVGVLSDTEQDAGRGYGRVSKSIQEGSLTKNEGGELEVGVGQRPTNIFVQD